MNGPSLTSSTAISAPNRPGRHAHPEPLQGRREPPVEPVCQLRRRRAGEPGPAAASRVRVQRELRHDERRAHRHRAATGSSDPRRRGRSGARRSAGPAHPRRPRRLPVRHRRRSRARGRSRRRVPHQRGRWPRSFAGGALSRGGTHAGAPRRGPHSSVGCGRTAPEAISSARHASASSPRRPAGARSAR